MRPHKVKGRVVDSKSCIKRRFSKTRCQFTVKMFFVGDIKKETGRHHLQEYFEQYGSTEVFEIMTDRGSGQVMSFAFITIDSLTSDELYFHYY